MKYGSFSSVVINVTACTEMNPFKAFGFSNTIMRTSPVRYIYVMAVKFN